MYLLALYQREMNTPDSGSMTTTMFCCSLVVDMRLDAITQMNHRWFDYGEG
jgi:hypothetical protein